MWPLLNLSLIEVKGMSLPLQMITLIKLFFFAGKIRIVWSIKELRFSCIKLNQNSIKTLRIDHGGKYWSIVFNDFREFNEIFRELLTAYTTQQKGVSQRE